MADGFTFWLAMNRAVQNGWDGPSKELAGHNRLADAERAVERGEHLGILRLPEFASRVYGPRFHQGVNWVVEVQAKSEAHRSAFLASDDPLDYLRGTIDYWNHGGMDFPTTGS